MYDGFQLRLRQKFAVPVLGGKPPPTGAGGTEGAVWALYWCTLAARPWRSSAQQAENIGAVVSRKGRIWKKGAGGGTSTAMIGEAFAASWLLPALRGELGEGARGRALYVASCCFAFRRSAAHSKVADLFRHRGSTCGVRKKGSGQSGPVSILSSGGAAGVEGDGAAGEGGAPQVTAVGGSSGAAGDNAAAAGDLIAMLVEQLAAAGGGGVGAGGGALRRRDDQFAAFVAGSGGGGGVGGGGVVARRANIVGEARGAHAIVAAVAAFEDFAGGGGGVPHHHPPAAGDDGDDGGGGAAPEGGGAGGGLRRRVVGGNNGNDDDTSGGGCNDAPPPPDSSIPFVRGQVLPYVEDIPPHAGLNEQQNAVRVAVLKALMMGGGGRGGGGGWRRIFVQGEAGTGKSHMIRAVAAEVCGLLRNANAVRCFTPTGVATENLVRGSVTLHRGFAIDVGCANTPRMPPLSDRQKDAIRTRFEGMEVAIIDEISMVTPDMLARVSFRLTEVADLLGRLRDNVPEAFGGYVVLALGDFRQIPPVGGRTLLAESMRPSESRRNMSGDGGRLWRTFRKLDLQQQMRAREPGQEARVAELKRGAISRAMVQGVRPLRPEDMRETFLHHRGVFITQSNAHRIAINNRMMRWFAAETGVPVIIWTNDLTGAGFAALPKEDLEMFSDEIPELTSCFVQGAPAMILHNFNPQLGLSNGSEATFVGLAGLEEGDAVAVMRGRPGEVVRLGRPPTHMLVHVPALDLVAGGGVVGGGGAPSSIVQQPFGSDDDGGDGGRVGGRRRCVPIPLRACEAKVGTKTISYRWHPVTPGFAVTTHKVQGKTLERAVLVMEEPRGGRGGTAALVFEMFLVMMTRVRCADHLRRMPQTGAEEEENMLRRVTALTPSPLVSSWFAGRFDADGFRAYDAVPGGCGGDVGGAGVGRKKAAPQRPPPPPPPAAAAAAAEEEEGASAAAPPDGEMMMQLDLVGRPGDDDGGEEARGLLRVGENIDSGCLDKVVWYWWRRVCGGAPPAAHFVSPSVFGLALGDDGGGGVARRAAAHRGPVVVALHDDGHFFVVRWDAVAAPGLIGLKDSIGTRGMGYVLRVVVPWVAGLYGAGVAWRAVSVECAQQPAGSNECAIHAVYNSIAWLFAGRAPLPKTAGQRNARKTRADFHRLWSAARADPELVRRAAEAAARFFR
ncbi:MAG: AAA family ATPase [Ramlibacter sp.]|nr:AAA family ATPase [Ramlibacter sp.]